MQQNLDTMAKNEPMRNLHCKSPERRPLGSANLTSTARLMFFACFLALCFISLPRANSFSILPPHSSTTKAVLAPSSPSTALFMSSRESDKKRTTKKGVEVMDRVETKPEQKKNKEEMWRVVLHNDEVHTFNYVVRSLTKVIGTLDRKAAFEVCVQTHGIGKATITKTWKKQAEQFCLGLQRQGLTVSISPDEDFDGGHSGGGL